MDLSVVVTSVRRHLLRILLVAAAAGGLAYVGSGLLPKSFTAEARVFVGSLTTANYDQQLAYENLAQTYAQLATTTPLLDRVIDALDLKERAEQLADRLDIRTPAGLSIIRISASAAQPGQAASIANALAGQVTGLARGPDPSAEPIATVVQPALPPPTPTSPRPLLNAVVAAALALVLAAGTAVLADRWRTTRSLATDPAG